ncbi:MAG TPA: UTP--glucose-1-phosphate uridylyltransferase GalU [Candidatus Bipolaricaulota bacterium]|nr:UTP--glucose-1-phosphate uridylyltransferase GalU [Candidatus Bipolaricaulota bacterium]
MKPIRKAVIAVAGFGTRFLPATIAQPKEMLPVVDKPVIQYIVEEMVASGIEEIIFITGRTKRAIEDHFDPSFELEYQLEEKGKKEELAEVRKISSMAKFVYVRQNKPLGNGHALLMAKEIVGDEPFVFSDGDSIIDSKVPAMKQLLQSYKKHPGNYVGVQKVDKKLVDRYGIVDPISSIGKLHKIKKTVEKPSLASAPSNLAILGMRYVLSEKIFEKLENTKPGKGGEIWLADAFNDLLKEEDGYALEYEGEYYDCGNKHGYLRANVNFGLKNASLRKEFLAFLKKTIK